MVMSVTVNIIDCIIILDIIQGRFLLPRHCKLLEASARLLWSSRTWCSR